MIEVITIASNLIVAVAALGGMVVAYFGLCTWNAQLKGTTKYKIAKDVLTKTFKLRGQINNARCPLITSAEMSHFQSEDSKLKIRGNPFLAEDDLITFNAIRERLQKVAEVKQELEINKLEADAVFGEEETKEIKTLIEKVHEMIRIFNFMWEMKVKGIEIDRETHMKYWHVLFGVLDEKDSFGREVEDLVNKIKERFRKYLK